MSKIVSIVEVINMRTYSKTRKTNKLRNIYTNGRGGRNISIKKWKINYFKIKVVTFIINLVVMMPFQGHLCNLVFYV